MISLTDMIGLCGLTQDEVDAIAEHEHIPEVAAAALGAYLLHKEHGSEDIRGMICDDIRDATKAGDFAHAAQLAMALRHFMETYGETVKSEA
jgi:hypothetical protein